MMTRPNHKTIIFSFLIFVMLVILAEGRSKFERSGPKGASKAKSPKEKGLSTSVKIFIIISDFPDYKKILYMTCCSTDY